MAVIETLMPFWPILALVWAFALGFGIAWWLRSEDARQMRAEIDRRARSYDELSAAVAPLGMKLDAAQADAVMRDQLVTAYEAQISDLKRGWQAVRAAVEQHTVKP